MFYCNKCATESTWPESISKSFGKCECCGNHGHCNDRPSSSLPMVEGDINNKVDDLINRFKNGNERYMSSALMNKCINSLARGGDQIEIIDQLLDIIDTQGTQLAKIIKNYGITYGTNHKK